jgi:hypothetical protein
MPAPAKTAGLDVRAGDGGDGDGTADYGKGKRHGDHQLFHVRAPLVKLACFIRAKYLGVHPRNSPSRKGRRDDETSSRSVQAHSLMRGDRY